MISSGKITFKIEGRWADIGSVWVHMQDCDDNCDRKQYCLSVSASEVDAVFDPYGERDPQTPLNEYIDALIEEFGTFILSAFFKQSRKILNVEKRPYSWVVATVDEISEVDQEISLRGWLVPFDRTRSITPVPLR